MKFSILFRFLSFLSVVQNSKTIRCMWILYTKNFVVKYFVRWVKLCGYFLSLQLLVINKFSCLIFVGQATRKNLYQRTALPPGIFLFWFGVAYELHVQLVSYGYKTVLQYANILIRQLLWLLFMYSWCDMESQATPKLPNACITGRDEFASNKLCVSRTLTIVFCIYLRLFSPAVNVYIHVLYMYI